MGNTVRRQPISFGIPNAPDYKYLNITSFKGMDITDNPLKADYSTASDVLNLYVDENNALTTRPRLEKTNDWFTTIPNFESVLHVYKLSDGLLFQIKTTSGVSLYVKKPGYTPESVTITSGITLSENKMAVLEKDSYIYVMDTDGYYVIEYTDTYNLDSVYSSDNTYVPDVYTGTIDSTGITTNDYEPFNTLTTKYNKLYAWDLNTDPEKALLNNRGIDYLFRKKTNRDFQYSKVLSSFDGGFIVTEVVDAGVQGEQLKYRKIYTNNDVVEGPAYTIARPFDADQGEAIGQNDVDWVVFLGAPGQNREYTRIRGVREDARTREYSIPSGYGIEDVWLTKDPFVLFGLIRKRDDNLIDHYNLCKFEYDGANWTQTTYPEFTIEAGDNYLQYGCKIACNSDYTKILVYGTKFCKIYTNFDSTVTVGDVNITHINSYIKAKDIIFNEDLSVYYIINSGNTAREKVVIGKINTSGGYDEKQLSTPEGAVGTITLGSVTKDTLVYTVVTPVGDTSAREYRVCKTNEQTSIILYDVLDELDTTFGYGSLYKNGSLYLTKYNSTPSRATRYNGLGTRHYYVDESVHFNLRVTYTSEDRELLNNFPNVLRFQNNWWFYGNKNKTWHTANNDPTYIPENAYDYLGVSDDDITDAVLAGQNTAIFFKKDHFYVVSPVTLSDGSVDYPAVEAKGVIGSIATNAAMVSPYKERPLYVGYDGVYSLQQLAYVQSSDHVSVMMSKSIEPRISKEPNLSQALSVGKLYWSMFAVPATKTFMDGSQTPETHCYVFDDRSDSWYYWTLPIDLAAIWLDKNEVYCCAKNGKIYTLKTTDIVNKYNDTVTDYYDDEEQIIEWRWVSQILPMNTINYRKRLINTTFIMTDTDSLDHYGLTYKFRVYRKLANESNPTTISNSMNYVTSVTKKTSISRFNFLQLELSNIPNNLSENKLRIIGLSFKYVLLEMN